MTQRFDVVVVGAGIVGLAHAWMAARRGYRVVVCDRSPRAVGASVRNFGMVWPIGQPAGELYQVAMTARECWLQLKADGLQEVDECGAVHVAHAADELAVLEEFSAAGTHDCRLLTSGETQELVPVVHSDGLLGGLFSPTELRVNPRLALAEIADYLRERHGVEFTWSTPIIRVDDGMAVSSTGERFSADRIIVCSGDDLTTLFPDVLASSGLKRCKLQMLRTRSHATTRQRAHVASGLTLRHYRSFESCPSLDALRARIARESPELDALGIHVMATQSADGSFILGDSHEYDEEISPFDKSEIDELILRELAKVIALPDWSIAERWHGVYAKHPELPVFEAQPVPGVFVCVGPGGAGMTMSFGLADRAWKQWEGTAE